MTDLPPDPLDELASAHLDGETTLEEEARLAGDPALQERVESLRAARDAVAQVEPSAADERAATVAAVLARLDEGAVVTPLAPVARRPGARAWRIVAAAAAVVAVALLIPLLARQDQSSQDAASSGAPEDVTQAPEPAQPQAEARAGDAEGGASTSTAVGPSVPDLGDFDSVAALESAVVAVDRSTTAFGAEGGASLHRSPSCVGALPADRVTRTLGTARVADRPVLVLLDEGGSRVVVLDSVSCAVVADDARP